MFPFFNKSSLGQYLTQGGQGFNVPQSSDVSGIANMFGGMFGMPSDMQFKVGPRPPPTGPFQVSGMQSPGARHGMLGNAAIRPTRPTGRFRSSFGF